jgi:ABC transporter, ATP-binding protein
MTFEHNNKFILKDISLNIESGDFISVVGPSGSGKSTLLKLCAHLISPTSGNITFNGRDFSDISSIDLRRNITYCFQTPYLFGKTVMENIEFPYTIRNMKINLTRINSLFAMFQMSEDYLQRDVQNLSGGEKQRIALIRSLVFVPKILLLDEVTSALDADNKSVVEKVISSVNDEGSTVLWITHDTEQSRKYADKVLAIDSGKIKSFEEVKR